jgi:hypothetical protein
MKTALIILAAIGAVACFIRAIWLGVQIAEENGATK